jgi:glycosyltransferase involved in cell wall biosynthesis
LTTAVDSVRRILRRSGAAASARWRPYSRLFLVGEGAHWVIDREVVAVAATAETLGIEVARRWPVGAARRQAVFYGSHFTLFDHFPAGRGHRIGTTYFHGRPGTPGMPEFDVAYEALRMRHQDLRRIQVSHREMLDVVLSSGIDPGKVFLIPIGVEPSYFGRRSPEERARTRAALGLARAAFVVGSFQKDGVGWGEGIEPKLVKGPDVLVDALAALNRGVPDLQVLLSGPARGYVIAGLERHGIPYVHRTLTRYEEIGTLYAAIDAYIVPARQEGGPKGVLEAMASGVPLVSTRVGQAVDLVRDGENGWLVEVEDAEALAGRLADVADRSVDVERATTAGLETAAANSYERQLPLWRQFFSGFVECR